MCICCFGGPEYFRILRRCVRVPLIFTKHFVYPTLSFIVATVLSGRFAGKRPYAVALPQMHELSHAYTSFMTSANAQKGVVYLADERALDWTHISYAYYGACRTLYTSGSVNNLLVVFPRLFGLTFNTTYAAVWAYNSGRIRGRMFPGPKGFKENDWQRFSFEKETVTRRVMRRIRTVLELAKLK